VLALCDAFLAVSAARNPAYRADLQPATSRAEAGPDRQFAIGPLAGAFTFRPKTYRELTSEERAAVWRDPALPAFLRAARIPPAAAAGRPGSREHPLRVSLEPAEMLLARPAAVALPGL
jgi:hypothetical protein